MTFTAAATSLDGDEMQHYATANLGLLFLPHMRQVPQNLMGCGPYILYLINKIFLSDDKEKTINISLK